MTKLTHVSARTLGNWDYRLPVGVDDVTTTPAYPSAAPPMTTAELARFDAELARLLEADEALTRNEKTPKRGVGSKYRDLLRAIESSRRCDAPVGLVMEGQTDPTARDLAIAPCRACPACRQWDRALDAWRLRESAGEAFALAVIPEARWSATKQRLTRAGSPYHSTPIQGDRRAVLVPAGSPVPGIPVEDLAEALASLDRQRNRADKRRVSSSGLRARAEVEALAYGNTREEEIPQARSVVGFFSARAVSASSDPAVVAQSVEAAAASLGIDTTRKGLTIAVDGHRYGPRLDALWRRLGVQWLEAAIPWHMGGPPPAVDSPGWETWQLARFGNAPTFEEPPMSAYTAAV